jgi:hypothetical protein
MNVKWDIELKNWQNLNPILEVHKLDIKINFIWDEIKAREVLTSKGHQLKTWGGAEKTSEPHWIGVTKQTPLHIDPRYPRYTWHLILKVDNFSIRGIDKIETILNDNIFILLDTHSPHQLFALDKKATYYFAASIDSNNILPFYYVKNKLIEFVEANEINNNTNRIKK